MSTGAAKGQRQDTRALSAFIATAVVALALFAAFLAVEIVQQRTAWPLGHTGWEIAEIIILLALMLAFGIFALVRWRELVRATTERKRVEEALRESEERWRSTLDGMMEGCQIIGFDWRYVYVNDAVARHGRRTKEELLGHTMMEMYPGIENTEMFGCLRRCMEERVPHRMENEFTYPDGAKAWFELSIQPVPEGIFILSLDITERKRAEEALRESEAKFRTLAETTSTAITVIQGEKFRYVNPATEAISGYAREELLAMDFWGLVHPNFREPNKERGLAWQRGGSAPPRFEFKIVTKGGEERWLDFTAGLAQFDGKLAVLGAAFDITERKRAEEALRAAREELEAKVERQMLRRNPYGLTFRELTVLHLVAAGESDRQIGIALGISHLTAQKHISNILAKMGAACRTEAGVRAVREGLLD